MIVMAVVLVLVFLHLSFMSVLTDKYLEYFSTPWSRLGFNATPIFLNSTEVLCLDTRLSTGLSSAAYLPRIIHQTYKSNDLPENFRTWRDECKMLNPCWEFKLWTDDDNLNLVKTFYPELLPLYEGYDVAIKRIDAVRYMMLHKYGGVYMDMDMTCLRSFNESTFREPNTFYAARQHRHAETDQEQRVANAFMASTPRHPLLSKILNGLHRTKDLHVVMATGPGFLTRMIDDEGQNDTIVEFPIEAFFSVSYDEKAEINICAANRSACKDKYPGYLFSFWTHTWK